MTIFKDFFSNWMSHWRGQLAFFVISSYLFFCVFQVFQPHIEYKSYQVSVIGEQNKLRKVDGKSFDIRRGEDIMVSFEIVRHYHGESHVDRVLTFDDTEYLLTSLDRVFAPTERAKRVYSVVVYDIPPFLEARCGYKVFSRGSPSYEFNILSLFIARPTVTPPIEFCIKD